LSPFVVRFQYNMPSGGNVTVKVYDFAMDCVTTVVDGAYRTQGDHYEEWFGQRSDGKAVATGVYYYSVERGGAGTAWGKVAVIY
jgi:flagellar hook assembly protein FlgD